MRSKTTYHVYNAEGWWLGLVEASGPLTAWFKAQLKFYKRALMMGMFNYVEPVHPRLRSKHLKRVK